MSRKIMALDASATCWVADATTEVASELEPDDQAYQELGELSCSLSGMRQSVCNWEKKLQKVLVDNIPLSVTTYQSRSCARERELCRLVHGDHG